MHILVIIILVLFLSFVVIGMGCLGIIHFICRYFFNFELSDDTEYNIAFLSWGLWFAFFILVIYMYVIDKPIYNNFGDYIIDQIPIFGTCIVGAVYWANKNKK